ncbi:hypothetical protein ACFLT2_10175 [Acidobacteriota bacterium]
MKKNRDFRRVVVEFHAGYKGEEEPRKVIAEEDEWAVEHILERKRIFDHKTGRSHEEFTCRVNKKLAKLSIYPDGQHYLTFLKT